jgi:hypothetical protein
MYVHMCVCVYVNNMCAFKHRNIFFLVSIWCMLAYRCMCVCEYVCIQAPQHILFGLDLVYACISVKAKTVEAHISIHNILFGLDLVYACIWWQKQYIYILCARASVYVCVHVCMCACMYVCMSGAKQMYRRVAGGSLCRCLSSKGDVCVCVCMWMGGWVQCTYLRQKECI